MKKSTFLQISLLTAMLLFIIVSFIPHQAQAHQEPLDCIDVENYGSGPKRTRICAASNCGLQNHEESENWGTCTITIE